MAVRLHIRSSLISLLFGGLICGAQTRDTLACVVRLDLPQYPALARAAQVQGRARAEFVVGKDGSPVEVVVSAPNRELKRLVESRMSTARFRQDCAGAKLELRIDFILRQPREKFGNTEIALLPPATIEVSTTLPEMIDTQP